MWSNLGKGFRSRSPIRHVTNGVHFRSWVSFEMNQLYDRYLGQSGAKTGGLRTMGTRPVDSGGGVVENARTAPRAACGLHAPTAAGPVLEPRRSKAEIDEAEEVLSPDALTIGFARRFASYKRANLLIRNPERLVRILNNPAHPVQIIYAGKAHPHDDTASS